MPVVNLTTSKEELEGLLEQKDYPVLEPGEYEFYLGEKLKMVKSKSSENQQLKVQLVNEEALGQKVVVFDNLVLTDNCRWKVGQFFKALGFSDEDIIAGINTDEQIEPGMKLRVRVAQEPRQDEPAKMRNVVKAYLFETPKADE